MAEFKIRVSYGYAEMKSFHRIENGRFVSYYYLIKYDGDGNEISRTEPESFGSIGFDNGQPVTQIDVTNFGGPICESRS